MSIFSQVFWRTIAYSTSFRPNLQSWVIVLLERKCYVWVMMRSRCLSHDAIAALLILPRSLDSAEADFCCLYCFFFYLHCTYSTHGSHWIYPNKYITGVVAVHSLTIIERSLCAAIASTQQRTVHVVSLLLLSLSDTFIQILSELSVPPQFKTYYFNW